LLQIDVTGSITVGEAKKKEKGNVVAEYANSLIILQLEQCVDVIKMLGGGNGNNNALKQ
jgi:hypothetical protein